MSEAPMGEIPGHLLLSPLMLAEIFANEGSLFTFFRWLAFVFVTIYVTITTAQSLWGWYVFLWQSDRYTNLLRSYVIVHGLRLRMRSFGGDAVVSALLCVAFLLMWKAHTYLDAIASVTASMKK